MKYALRFVLAASALCAALQLTAQEAAGPPAVLRAIREDIKEGKDAAHEKTEAAFMQAAGQADYKGAVLGMNSMSGTSQAWFLEGFRSFAALAEASKFFESHPEFGPLDSADAEFRTSSRAVIAVYRPEMSYGTDQIKLSKARFINVITIRVRPGQDQEFTDMARMLVAAAAKSGEGQPVATYQVVSGAPNGAYLLLEPTESLKSMDEAPQRRQAVNEALGDSGLKRLAKAAGETIANEESTLFAIRPAMSYPPKAWATEDPDFWGPKVTQTSTKGPAKSAHKAAKEKTAAK